MGFDSMSNGSIQQILSLVQVLQPVVEPGMYREWKHSLMETVSNKYS
jgi:hypothetical protein